MKNIKFYVVKDFTNDLLNKTKTRFDLYTCSNETTIKGATLVIPSFSLHVKVIDRTLCYNINSEVYEKVFGVKPVYQVTDILNFPIFGLPETSFKVDNFIRDVNWVKNVSYKDVESLFTKSLNTFLLKEFGDGLTISDDNVNVIVHYINDMEAINIEINVGIDKDDLIRLTRNSSHKFSPLLRDSVHDFNSLISFVE